MAADGKTKGQPHDVSSNNPEEPTAVPGTGEKTTKLSFAERQAALRDICLKPFLCPISSCTSCLTVTNLLSHALYNHPKEFRVVKAYAGLHTVFECKISQFKFGETKCLGLICYTGTTQSSMKHTSLQPGQRLICLPNKWLLGPYKGLKFVMPIYVMACRTSWGLASLHVNERKDYAPKANEEFMLFWLMGAPALKILHGAVTVFDPAVTTSLGSLLEVRQSQSVPDLKDIMAKHSQYLVWGSSGASNFSAEAKQKVLIEIFIHEFDLKLQKE